MHYNYPSCYKEGLYETSEVQAIYKSLLMVARAVSAFCSDWRIGRFCFELLLLSRPTGQVGGNLEISTVHNTTCTGHNLALSRLFT
jgi:hypothetical protein